ncbi:hypothetical protein [Bacillus amyloliquefaciens]|uniref:hypothetical protein n=1 Tax=Bacillus amyloliquefaciens TaxID=1390 RepID=UPI000B444BCC|nr:hypothetical protein [Bacillus amyloliquefaciens]ARW40240.1 hypothetical protein S101267_03180 [Bacillus amyloliquefaciens]
MADKRESTGNSEMARVDTPKFSLESKTGNIYATGDINVKVNVEVSEAITGLKALQREAKAATKALAELREEQQAVYDAGLCLDEKEIRRVSFRKGDR